MLIGQPPCLMVTLGAYTPTAYPLRSGRYDVCTVDTMYMWLDGTAYVPQKQFWVIALLSLYSMVFNVFPLAALFSNCQHYGRKWE